MVGRVQGRTTRGVTRWQRREWRILLASHETASSSASSAYRFAGAAMLRSLWLTGTESTLQAGRHVGRCATASPAETCKNNRDRGAARGLGEATAMRWTLEDRCRKRCGEGGTGALRPFSRHAARTFLRVADCSVGVLHGEAQRESLVDEIDEPIADKADTGRARCSRHGWCEGHTRVLRGSYHCTPSSSGVDVVGS